MMPRIPIDNLLKHLVWEDLDPTAVRQLISTAKDEDLSGFGLKRAPERTGDATTALVGHATHGSALLIAREQMVACGLPLVDLVLEAYGGNCRFTHDVDDGTWVESGTTLGRIEGPATTLLQAERILLNFLQHLSGISSETRRYADALAGSRTVLLDTRKTTPGYRALEKYAFACGGGYNHRIGLFDRIMLKDNHLAATGATAGNRLADSVRTARKSRPDLPVEVEIDHLEQIQPVLDAGADIVLLDNFTNIQIIEAKHLIGEAAYTEASGGITLARLPELAKLGLDFISTGAPVHQSTWVDIGMDWDLSGARQAPSQRLL